MNRFLKQFIVVLILCLAILPAGAQHDTGQLELAPEKLYEYAAGLYKRGHYDMAMGEVARFLAKYPKNQYAEDVELLRINCLIKLGREQEFLELIRGYRENRKNGKYGDELLKVAGDALFSGKKYSEATEFYQELAKSASPLFRETGMFYLAQCFAQTERKDGAAELYAKLAELPFSREFIYRQYAAAELAAIYSESGKLNEALELYDGLTANQETDKALAEAALYYSGEIRFKLRDYVKARELVEAYLGKFRNGIFARNARTIRVHAEMALENYEKAAEYAADWREKYPEAGDSDMDYCQAAALLQCRRYDEALPFFQRVEADPDAAMQTRQEACYNSLICLMAGKYYMEAEGRAAGFLEKYPKSSHLGDVLQWHGYAASECGKFEAAEQSLRKALVFFAETPEKFIETGEQLTALLLKQQKKQEAAAVLRKIGNSPLIEEADQYLLRAGDLAQETGDTAAAGEDYTKVAENAAKKESAAYALRRLAQIHIDAGDYKGAMKYGEKLALMSTGRELAELESWMASLAYRDADPGRAENYAVKALNSGLLPPEGTAGTRLLLSQIYIDDKQYGKAVPLLDILLEKGGDTLSTGFLAQAARVYKEQKEYAKSAKSLEMLLKHKEAGTVETALAKLELAQLHLLSDRKREAVALLMELAGTDGVSAEIPSQLVYSLIGEIRMELGDWDAAVIAAEKALAAGDGDREAQARALYVMAKIRLKAEKRALQANSYATQGYILLDDAKYSPLCMVLSMEAFLEMGKTDSARAVFAELEGKYPAWLAEHPEARPALPPKSGK